MLCWLGYGTWSCLIATDRSCRVESNRAGRGRVTFSFQILQYCIAEREHGASNGRSNSVKRQRQHLQRLWPLPSLPPLWSQEPHSGSWSPMVTREAELCVVGWAQDVFQCRDSECKTETLNNFGQMWQPVRIVIITIITSFKYYLIYLFNMYFRGRYIIHWNYW